MYPIRNRNNATRRRRRRLKKQQERNKKKPEEEEEEEQKEQEEKSQEQEKNKKEHKQEQAEEGRTRGRSSPATFNLHQHPLALNRDHQTLGDGSDLCCLPFLRHLNMLPPEVSSLPPGWPSRGISRYLARGEEKVALPSISSACCCSTESLR